MAVDGTTYTWPIWDGQRRSSALPGRAFQEPGKGGCLIQARAEELAETYSHGFLLSKAVSEWARV